MSKTLIKTMISELGSVIPQDELDKIADKITEVIDLKTKATRSNIDPLAKSERVKSAILQLGNIKEEIIEKLYDHGVEEPDKIRNLTLKTMQKIDKAMNSKYVIKDGTPSGYPEAQSADETKEEQPVIVQDPTAPKQGEPSTPKEDKDKVNDGGNNIISNIPEKSLQLGRSHKPALQQAAERREPLVHLPNKSQILTFIDNKFKIALNERPNEIKNIWDKYKEENENFNEAAVSGEPKAYPLEFKKSIIKTNKIFSNIDEYFDIPEEVPTPTFEEIFNAVEQTKEKRKLEKLINLSEIIEDNRREKEKRAFSPEETPKGDLPERAFSPELLRSEELPPPPPPTPKRIGKLKFK